MGRLPFRARLGWCLVVLGVLTATSACGSHEGGAPALAPAPLPTQGLHVDSAPEWRPGDRWVYEWTSGSDRGTKTVEVTEIRELKGVQYYIVRLGDIDHFYTRELHWAAAVRDSTVEARMIPPHAWFVWPLEVGRRWVHRGTWEDRGTTRPTNDSFAVVAAETVEVPAGAFQALKVARESSIQGLDEYWYAPAVRSYARWIGRRGDVSFEERLREYRPAPRLIPDASGPRR